MTVRAMARIIPWHGVQEARAAYRRATAAGNGTAGAALSGDGRLYVAQKVGDEFVDAHDLVVVAVPAGEGAQVLDALRGRGLYLNNEPPVIMSQRGRR